MTALILDCDGVLADTERDGHLVAFNETFAELGLAVRWTPENYARLLRIGGGKERLRSLFDHADNPSPDVAGVPRSEGELDALIRTIHAMKTARFIDLVSAGRIAPRPGVRRVVEEARAAGWQLAVASTSAEESVRSVLQSVVGADNASVFAGIFAGDQVRTKKPAPDIYLLACEKLGVGAGTAVVVEDSAVGAAAAAAAGLGHLVTVSAFTREESFPTAAAVVTSLGDDREPTVCLAHAQIPAPGHLVTLEDLDRVRCAVPPTAPIAPSHAH